jgi:hypothetical protein
VFAALLIGTFDMIMSDVNESRILNLSRVMGLQQVSKIFFQLMIAGMSILLISLPIMIFVKASYLPNADWTMFIFGSIVMFMPQLA